MILFGALIILAAAVWLAVGLDRHLNAIVDVTARVTAQTFLVGGLILGVLLSAGIILLAAFLLS